MVDLAFLRARHMASPAIQRCLQVIHTTVTHSRTVVHAMYYTAKRRPVEKDAARTHAV